MIFGLGGALSAWQLHYNQQVISGNIGTGANAGSRIEEDRPKDTEFNSHKVGADDPRHLTIDKLGIKARVFGVGVTASGELDAPLNIHDIGWFRGGGKPGRPGALLMDGHVSGWTQDGVFKKLKQLAKGDTIQIERGDGEAFAYKVQKVEIIPVGQVDMNKLQKPYSGDQGLNLITCGGDFDRVKEEYTHRVVVYATR